MRLLKLFKLLAPIGLAVVVLGTNPESSNGQFPGGDRGGRDRGGRDRGAPGGEQATPGAIQFQFPQGGPPTGASPMGGSPMGGAPGGFGGFGRDRGSDRGGDRGSRGMSGFGGSPMGGGMTPGGGSGFSGFGGGGFNMSSMADSSFARLQASYGGSGDTLDYSKIPAATREQSNAMAQRFGGEAMPASGVISKDQYRDQMNKRMEAMRGGGGRGGFTMTMSAPSATPGATGAVSFETPGAAPGSTPGMQPQWGSMQPGGGFGGRGGPQGGTDPSQVTDQQVMEYMRRYDRDNDGKISAAEAQQSDRLRGVFQQYDKNADGSLDFAEYKAYIVDRFSGQGQSQGSPGSSWGQNGWGGAPGGWGGPDGSGGPPRGPVEEPMPVVLRYGKLPKELPSWFNTMDTNKDGQIALYEWRNEGRLATDFSPMDLNADGLVTAEEYLRYKNPSLSASATPGAPGDARGGNPFGGGGRSASPFGGSGGSGNPFSRGSDPRTETKSDSGSSDRRDRGGPPSAGDKGSDRGRGGPPSGGGNDRGHGGPPSGGPGGNPFSRGGR